MKDWVFLICGYLIALLIFFVPIVINFNDPYTLEEYIVQPGDTFWEIYMNKYSEHINYQEALYNFKKDNNMQQYELYEGQTIILRKYE